MRKHRENCVHIWKLKFSTSKIAYLQSNTTFATLNKINLLEFLTTLYNCSGLLIGQQCTQINAHISIADECHSFYHCDVTGKLVLKNCGPGTMFNPVVNICDWPLNVYKIRPECKQEQAATTQRYITK